MVRRRPGDNPFRSSRIEALAYRDPDAPDADDFAGDLLRRWHDLGRRGVLVGPKGHGKTTLLEQLERRLESEDHAEGQEVRRLRLHVDSPTPDAETRRRLSENLHDGIVISIDGLELLSPWTWWRLRRDWREAGGILATAHRPGRLPTLHEHRTTPALLRSLVRELLGDEDFERVQGRLDELFERQGGNVRECLRELYDRFAKPTERPANEG